MKKTNLIFISYSQLYALNLHKVNRCGYTDKEEALRNGFTEFDYNKFMSRVKITLKDIKNNGYLETSTLIIARCKDDGKVYLIEGQGRRAAIIMGMENGDFIIDKIPCLMYEDDLSFQEIGEKIRIHNTKKRTNWACADISKSGARELGGDYEWAYNFVEVYKLRTKCNSYMANLMVYGEKHSHKRNSVLPFTSKDFRDNHELFMELYETFIDNFGEKQNISASLRHKKVIKSDIGIIFNSFFTFLYKECNENNIDPNIYLKKILKKMCDWSNRIANLKVQDFLSFIDLKKDDKCLFYQKLNVNKMIKEVFPEECIDNISTHASCWSSGLNSSIYKKVA